MLFTTGVANVRIEVKNGGYIFIEMTAREAGSEEEVIKGHDDEMKILRQ